MTAQLLSKEEFCRHHIESPAWVAIARATLPTGQHSLDGWKILWQQILAKPIK